MMAIQQDRPEFKEFIRKYIGKPYKSSSIELCLSACRSNTKHDPQSLFCSELVALTLQDSGLANLDMLANNYVPADFSMQSSKPVKLIGANLGDEIAVFALNKGFFGKTVDKFINMLSHIRTYFSSRP